DVSELVQTLGTSRLEFAAEANGLVLSHAVLGLPILTSDPPLLSLLDQHAEQSLAARASPSRLLGRVRQSVRDNLRRESPSLETIAAALKMSPRTLQRRLGEEGASFQQLVDSVREELARVHVGQGKMTLAEIAFELGYAEQSAFLRAFKRWTGLTPTEFKR